MPHALCRGHSHTSMKELWSQLLPRTGEENLPYQVDRAEDRHNTVTPTRAAIEKKTYIREESLASLRRWVEMSWSRVSQARGTV